jgi:hypothetical protein
LSTSEKRLNDTSSKKRLRSRETITYRVERVRERELLGWIS